MSLEDWRAWEALRGRLLERDPRHFHLFAGGRYRGTYGRYYRARATLDGDARLTQGIIVKWMDIAFERFGRVMIDFYWRAMPMLPERIQPADETPTSVTEQDVLLIERLNYDYPAEWEGRYAVIAGGAVQGAYTYVREAHSRVASLKDAGNVFITPVGLPSLEGNWYVKVVEAFYGREEGR